MHFPSRGNGNTRKGEMEIPEPEASVICSVNIRYPLSKTDYIYSKLYKTFHLFSMLFTARKRQKQKKKKQSPFFVPLKRLKIPCALEILKKIKYN